MIKTEPLSIKLTVFQMVSVTESTCASRSVIRLKRLALKIPATTTAIIPETFISSAKKKVTKGRLSSSKSSLAISDTWALIKSLCSQRLRPALSIPMAKPPIIERTKEILAFPREKLPVVQARRATRKATRPDASLSKPSPFRIFSTRLGKEKRSEREAKATKSVGPRAAPTATQAAKGKAPQRR